MLVVIAIETPALLISIKIKIYQPAKRPLIYSYGSKS
jgi:hypothetical protein